MFYRVNLLCRLLSVPCSTCLRMVRWGHNLLPRLTMLDFLALEVREPQNVTGLVTCRCVDQNFERFICGFIEQDLRAGIQVELSPDCRLTFLKFNAILCHFLAWLGS